MSQNVWTHLKDLAAFFVRFLKGSWLFYELGVKVTFQQETFTYMMHSDKQKKFSRSVLRKRCSKNMQQIYRRTPMPKYDFNKVILQLYWNRTSAWVFHMFRTHFYKNTYGELLLDTWLRYIQTFTIRFL